MAGTVSNVYFYTRIGVRTYAVRRIISLLHTAGSSSEETVINICKEVV